MNRAEHLAWAKERALAYLDTGNLADAFASMLSDLGKHPELKIQAHVGPPLELMGMYYVQHGDARSLRSWITGFN